SAPNSPLLVFPKKQVCEEASPQPWLLNITENHPWNQRSKEKESQSERISLDAYQDYENHYLEKLLVVKVLTWDLLQMSIHKQLIDLHSPSEIIKQIIFVSTEPGIKVEVIIADT
ncbi:hypothetical protein EI555_018867, partial [Monodon monoceros]